jgi:predicted esterase
MDTMKQTMDLYRNQSFTEAYAILSQQGDNFPQQAPMILYLRSCLAARINKPQLAIDLLQEAIDRGFWYGEQMMRQSPSWQSLQGLPAFEHLAEVCKTRQMRAETETRSQRLTVEPEQGCTPDQPCPLLMALHGNGDNATNALNGWRAVANEGWLLASIQSSQVVSIKAYVWDDQTPARREIEEQYAQLKEEYRIDRNHIIFAGFSMGAETALRLALSKAIPMQGFILLGPGGPTTADPAAWQLLLEQEGTHNLRGYVMLGEEDQGIPHENIRRLVEMLNTRNIPCKLEIIPNLEHEYPQDISPYLKRALAFIYGET